MQSCMRHEAICDPMNGLRARFPHTHGGNPQSRQMGSEVQACISRLGGGAVAGMQSDGPASRLMHGVRELSGRPTPLSGVSVVPNARGSAVRNLMQSSSGAWRNLASNSGGTPAWIPIAAGCPVPVCPHLPQASTATAPFPRLVGARGRAYAASRGAMSAPRGPVQSPATCENRTERTFSRLSTPILGN